MPDQNQIIRDISPDPILGNSRRAQLENFVILHDLEMILQARVITLDGEGIPLTEKIQNSETLTLEQKAQYMANYGDRMVNRTTAGSFVDSATGQVLAGPDEPNAIPERLFFQEISISKLRAMGMTVDDDTKVLDLVYAMLGGQLEAINQRNGF